MPKFVCGKCHREFWGWGVNYKYMSGEKVTCPDCKGTLVFQKENNGVKDSEQKVIKPSTAA
ncbi:MAG: hypothetical protein HY891_07615 [Deltaproteobacteria bacterium]|nr:hypothetical protein [Deltaproteobacteria bacterium]